MFSLHLIGGVSALALASVAVAQEMVVTQVEAAEAAAPVVTPNCGGGVVYDDGVFNNAYSIGDGDPDDATVVMKFDLPPGNTTVEQVCVCFTRVGEPTAMNFEYVFYDDNGAGGQPGTEIGAADATATSIPFFPAVQFYSLTLPAGTELPDTGVYIGARWPGGNILMCGDASPGTPQRANFGSANAGASWLNTTTLFPTAPPRAMGIRVDAAATASCVPTSTRLCLEGGRFAVEATWETAAGASGDAQVFKLTDDTGYLWFFNPSNVEAVVKIHNACVPPYNRFWFFAGGLTNVRTRIVVTDTKFPELPPKVYINPQETPFRPIQDNDAFATCP